MTASPLRSNDRAAGAPRALSGLVLAGAALSFAASPAPAVIALEEPPAIADIQSVYAWMNQDATSVNLVMTVSPFDDNTMPFRDGFQYVFHVATHAAMASQPIKETRIICQFIKLTDVECWVGKSYLRVNPTVLSARDGTPGIRVFAGRRGDPFFFHEAGLRRALPKLRTLAAAAGPLLQCPAISPAQGSEVLQDLRANPVDRYIDTNVYALVLVVDKELLLVNASSPILSVWGSTHRL